MTPPAARARPASPDQRARLAVLAALRLHDDLARDYVLKGGLVLQRVYGSPRASDDIDLNHVRAHENALTDAHARTLQDVCDRLGAGLGQTASEFGLDAASLRVVKWSDLLPTVFAEARYRTDDDEPAEGAVEVQVTLCERVCHTALARIDGVPVLASTLDDVVADKLKVLLQQRRRHKVRHSDVYDLWFALAEAPFVPDPAVVREALLVKLASWPSYLPLTAAAFRARAVRTFAEQGYRALRAEQPALPFAPFDVVWEAIQAFVDAMGLPEGDPAT
ncbi:nucleotidyl transferase AbiEii/AbiGii toxin family protein [Rubrivirga sp.]|uniref:nucleotidyl transferase AbiEii/AbiGii toxin family protein n=1 Tax=Rubrivirga sp. TaxID=1885344 RepID=UPI003B515C2F